MRGDSEYVNLVGITAARIILRRMVACAELFKVLLPQGICGVLAKLGGATDTVHVELTDRLARFWCAGTEFISRLIDTDPQDYRPLLTRSARVDEPIRFTGADLMSAVQRAAPIINDGERERGLTLDVADGHMTIDGGIASVAEFHDEIEASGPAWHAQFQIGYLRDALTAFGAGDVEIHPSEHAIRLCPAGEAHDCAIIARLRE
jgi:DNA polymerase III sliding clamp (beta) subunit (PCNA family)